VVSTHPLIWDSSGHIALDPKDLLARFIGDSFRGFHRLRPIEVGDPHLGSRCGKSKGDRLADILGASGNQGDMIGHAKLGEWIERHGRIPRGLLFPEGVFGLVSRVLAVHRRSP
jgi:hypothetical protein